MRLGQLARKLEVSSDQIVKILEENFREVSNHPNSKVTDEEQAFLVDHFSEPAVEETPEEPLLEDVADTELPIPEQAEIEEESLPEFVEELRPKSITLEAEFHAQTEDLESYKAEKVELEGLKVLGKIDLPEPPPKKEKEDKEEDSPRNRRRHSKDRFNKRRKKPTDSIAAQRKKEERLAKKRKYEEEKRKRELKKKHYEEQVLSKVKHQSRKKKKKKAIQEGVQQNSEKPVMQKRTGKGPLKRFWLWLNGAYDKYD